MDLSGNVHEFPKTYWRDIELPTFNTLKKDLTVDVAIIGAGIAGITSAYLLSKEGVKVAVIEARRILNGTTSNTTAKLTAQHILIYDHLIKYFGEEKAKLYYEFSSNAIPFVENTSRENRLTVISADKMRMFMLLQISLLKILRKSGQLIKS